MADRTLTCRDCGNPFGFTEGEQEFYKKKGFNDPVRCPQCRQAKKQQRDNRDFRNDRPYNRDNRGGRY